MLAVYFLTPDWLLQQNNIPKYFRCSQQNGWVVWWYFIVPTYQSERSKYTQSCAFDGFGVGQRHIQYTKNNNCAVKQIPLVLAILFEAKSDQFQSHFHHENSSKNLGSKTWNKLPCEQALPLPSPTAVSPGATEELARKLEINQQNVSRDINNDEDWTF